MQKHWNKSHVLYMYFSVAGRKLIVFLLLFSIVYTIVHIPFVNTALLLLTSCKHKLIVLQAKGNNNLLISQDIIYSPTSFTYTMYVTTVLPI